MNISLQVSPAMLSTVGSLTTLPWTCKPIYGFVSDAFPVNGYRRKPYLLLAGILGSVSWILMSLWVNSIFSGAACMIVGSAAIAMANVIAEAMISRVCFTTPKYHLGCTSKYYLLFHFSRIPELRVRARESRE